MRRSTSLPGPAVGVAGRDLRHHALERFIEIDLLRVRETDDHEQDVGELERQVARALFLLLGLFAEAVIDFAGPLPALFTEPPHVVERREVAFLILADPLIDALLRLA